MYPSTHDIIEPVNMHVTHISNMIKSGYLVLVVTKAKYSTIKQLANKLIANKNSILFRITIGSSNNDILKIWEPNASTFDNRLKTLKYLSKNGFKTSVSCEPILDINIYKVVESTLPYITENLWLGLPNKLRHRVSINTENNETYMKLANNLIHTLNNDFVKLLYKRYSTNSKIKWNKSIKDIVGLDLPTKHETII